jgi:hypothetical protein
MTMIHFKDSTLANESKHDNGFKITSHWNSEYCFSIIWSFFWKYLSRDVMTVKSYGCNSPRQVTHGKPEMFGCKLRCVCSTGGHCLIWKGGRYGHSNWTVHLLTNTGNRYTGPSGL